MAKRTVKARPKRDEKTSLTAPQGSGLGSVRRGGERWEQAHTVREIPLLNTKYALIHYCN